MKTKSIAIGSDHAGFKLKNELIVYLVESGFDVQDFGPEGEDSVDYPDYAHPVAESISDGEYDCGILICGSGNGVCMTANKHEGVRAALCWNVEVGQLAKQHNNANIICLPARYISKKMAIAITEAWLSSEFEGGRHENRVNKIDE